MPACEGMSCETGAWKDSDEGWEDEEDQDGTRTKDATSDKVQSSAPSGGVGASASSSSSSSIVLRERASAQSARLSAKDSGSHTQSLVGMYGDGKKVRRGTDPKAMPQGEVRLMACRFMGHSGDDRRKDLLKQMYRCVI